VIEQVRRRYYFVVVGYVIMLEHIHLLLTEPKRGNPSKVMQAIKQGFARRLLIRLRAGNEPWGGNSRDTVLGDAHIWQARFYDFVVFTGKKRVEKVRYMHRNPVKRGLVQEPQQWQWSSCWHYEFGERGIVLVDEEQKATLTVGEIA
jgi:putative transposase